MMKKQPQILVLLFLILAIFLSGCTAASGAAVNTWGSATIADGMVYYAGGNQVLALSDSGSNYTVRWMYPAKASASRLFMAEPLLAGEQLIVGDYAHLLTSVRITDGTENWQFAEAKERYIDSPLLVGDVLYAPNADGNVYAVDLNGILVWKFTADGALWARPATDGTLLFVPSLNHKLYAVDLSTGEKAWEVDLSSPLVMRPLYADGVIYLGNLTGGFYAVNAADGTIKWAQNLGGGLWGQPLLVDGKLYFGDEAGMVNILTAEDGKVIDQSDLGSSVIGSGAITPDGFIFGTESGKIVLVDAEGKTRPLLTLEAGSIYSNIIVSGDRMVVLAFKGNSPLYALDLNGNEAWNYSTKK
jgi:outer membrane protein assembly factor BamB